MIQWFFVLHPFFLGGDGETLPTLVTVNTYLRSIDKIDDYKMVSSCASIEYMLFQLLWKRVFINAMTLCMLFFQIWNKRFFYQLFIFFVSKRYILSRCWAIHLFIQEYSVQITFREDWNDPRLVYNDFQGKLTCILSHSGSFSYFFVSYLMVVFRPSSAIFSVFQLFIEYIYETNMEFFAPLCV